MVEHGLRVFEELAQPGADDVLLMTDLHGGNVLSAQRVEWLAMDPKPFAGDRAYDATQHLLNCRERLAARPLETIRRLADLAGVDGTCLRRWLFARAAAEPRDDWRDESLPRLARALAD